jgi:hypothetical protein
MEAGWSSTEVWRPGFGRTDAAKPLIHANSDRVNREASDRNDAHQTVSARRPVHGAVEFAVFFGLGVSDDEACGNSRQ